MAPYTVQYAKERVEDYVAELKKQAARCGFEVQEMDNQIRDELKSTCPVMKVIELILREEDLSILKSVQIWTLDEAVKQHVKVMEADQDDSQVNKIRGFKKKYDTQV